LKALGRGPVGPRDIKGGLEEIIEFLQDAKTQTSKTLEVTELMPNRLASPIELKTDNNLRYLVFIDIGQQGQLWSPEEMRLSHHGFPHTETN